MSDLSHSFGRSTVEPHERERRVRSLFSRIAGRYDLMNDVMSFGVHRLWKRALAWAADARAAQCIVDLAGGTGDVAALLSAPDRRVIVCDPSLPMMCAGRLRRSRAGGAAQIRWLAAAGERLPLADETVDTVTMAFGIRNVTRIDAVLGEIHRTLKPGGRFACLEFSQPRALIRPWYEAYSRAVIPRLGGWIARDPEAYRYLVESIRRFPAREALSRRFVEAGFTDVHHHDLSLGIACIHLGFKPERGADE